MTTAIGAYATLAAVKARLSGTFDSADDTLLGTLCDQVNAYIESGSGTGRVLAPRPVGSGVASANEIQSVTLAKSVGNPTGGTWTLTFNGSTTTDLAWNISAANLQIALRLLPTINGANVTVTNTAPYLVEFIGAFAGLAQSLMTADASNLTVAPCTATVALVSTPQTALYYFDVDYPGGRVLWLDVRSVTSLYTTTITGGAYTLLDPTNYFLRPLPQDREPGWPATRIELSDVSASLSFWPGYNTVKLIGVVGWPAIPDDITDVALTMAVRSWHARQSGQTDIVGSDETGAPIVSRFLSSRDRETLKRYRVVPSVR